MKILPCLGAILLCSGGVFAQNKTAPATAAKPPAMKVESWDKVDANKLQKLLETKLNDANFAEGKALSDALKADINIVVVEVNYPKEPYLEVSFTYKGNQPPAGGEDLAKKFINKVFEEDYLAANFDKTQPAAAFDANGLTDQALKIKFTKRLGIDKWEEFDPAFVKQDVEVRLNDPKNTAAAKLSGTLNLKQGDVDQNAFELKLNFPKEPFLEVTFLCSKDTDQTKAASEARDYAS